MLKDIYEVCLNEYGIKHSNTLMMMDYLAHVYHTHENYEESEKLYQDCYQLRLEVDGIENVNTLSTLHNLIVTLQSQEKYNECTDLVSRCFFSRTKILGKSHPNTLETMNLRGFIASKLNEDVFAAKTFETSYLLHCEVYGSNHKETKKVRSLYMMTDFKKQLKEIAGWNKN